jgi:hypothetical protein
MAREINDDEIESCHRALCETATYLAFGGRHEAPIIYALDDLFVLDASGRPR